MKLSFLYTLTLGAAFILSAVQPAAAASDRDVAISQVKEMSDDEIRVMILESADQIEQKAKAPETTDGPALTEEDRANMLILANGMRTQAEKPKLKKRILKGLKTGGKGMLVGGGWISYAFGSLIMSPFSTVVGFGVGLAGGFEGAQQITNSRYLPGRALFELQDAGGLLYMISDIWILSAVGVTGAGAVIPSMILPLVAMATVENECHGKERPEAGTAMETFCKGADVIDAIITRPVVAASSYTGGAIHEGVKFVVKKVKKVFKRNNKREEQTVLEITPIVPSTPEAPVLP